MSASMPSQKVLLPMCPDDVRVGAWVKSFSAFKKGVRPAYAWEPVIYRGGRNPGAGFPHSLRHTFITLSLDAGAGVREVQNSVGHADARMVSYYDRAKNSLAKNTTHLVAAFLES